MSAATPPRRARGRRASVPPVLRSDVRAVAALCAAAGTVVAGGRAARADGYSLHVLGAAQVAWTDNLFSVPEDQAGVDLPPREGDVYYQLRPGAMATYETPRSMHVASYELEANLYTIHDEAWSLQHRLGWQGFFLVSPRAELGGSLQLSSGQLTTLSTQGTAADGSVIGLPSGESRFLSLDAGQNLAFTASRELRLTQGARARSFSTTDAFAAESLGVEVGVSGGADRSWRHSAVGLQVAGAFVTLERRREMVAPETTDQVNASAILSWRRDFGPRWTSMIDGGMTAIVPLDEGDQLVLHPTVGGQVGYFPEWGNGGLAVRRAVAPNLYLARNTITDSVVVNAWLPLPWLTDDPLLPRLSVQGTVGAQRTRLIDTSTGETESGFDVLTGDVAIMYAPRHALSLAVRYQHLRQLSAEDAAVDVLSYVRNTVMITATGRFPERMAAEIPLRASLRVDRGDTTPVGEEVVAPDGGGGGGGR